MVEKHQVPPDAPGSRLPPPVRPTGGPGWCSCVQDSWYRVRMPGPDQLCNSARQGGFHAYAAKLGCFSKIRLSPCGVCGAWSVAMTASVPSRSASQIARRSSSVRSGGLMRLSASRSKSAPSVKGKIMRGGLARYPHATALSIAYRRADRQC